MMTAQHVPLSVLSLGPVMSDGTIAGAFKNIETIAQATEKLGYKRFWIAEHHSLPGVTTAATPVVIGHIAGLTSTMRVGSGGIMLPNHAPLVVAETFGTLATLYPGRIDLGLGRAPGTDPLTSRALRRDLKFTGNDFPDLVEELQAFFNPVVPGQKIMAVPGAGIDVPLWILGSSLWSADYAASKGLPYAFAAHFAPAQLMEAIEIYRSRFQPSDVLEKPFMMVCLPVIAADTDIKAEYLSTTVKQKILGLVTGRYPTKAPAPVDNMDILWGLREKNAVESFLSELIVGGPQTVKQKLEEFVKRTGADELMIQTDVYQTEDAVRSFEIIKSVWS
jgi:luciferase family oxidoreductase group 1